MKTSFLFTILVTWLCINELNGADVQCEVCSDSNDPNCRKVELKRCSSEQPYCIHAYYQPSSDIKSPNGRLIKQCGRLCPKIGRKEADICDICPPDNECNKQRTIEFYMKRLHIIKLLHEHPERNLHLHAYVIP